MRCSQVQNLLPEYVEGALAAPQQEELSAHLCACPTCAAEEHSYQVAFQALNTRKSGNTPDLWAAFSARLANELSCAEARELIPLQADPPLLANRADALKSHLASCEPCASDAAMMGRAVHAIDSVPSSLQEVDLWPAFAARTKNAPARTSLFGSVRRALSPARNPLAAPILAMAAFAGIVFAAQSLLTNAPNDVAVQPSTPTPVHVTVPEAVKPTAALKAVAKAAPAPSEPKRAVRKHRAPSVVASAVAPNTSRSAAAVVAHVTKSVRPRPQVVAFDPGLTPTADTTLVSAPAVTDTNTDAAQRKVMPEVVQAVALLLDFGDSAKDPFGGGQ